MNYIEKIEHIPKKQNSKEVKSFNPEKQRLEWTFNFVNDEYKKKTWEDLHNDIKKLLEKSLEWKSEEERDNILDNVLDSIQDSDESVEEIRVYLEWEIKENQDSAENEQSVVENEQSVVERQQVTIEKEQVINLVNSLSTLDRNKKDYNSILQRVIELKSKTDEDWFKEELDSILTELKNNKEALTAISLDLQEQDRQNWTNTFETFKSSLISLDPSFRNILPSIEAKAKLALWTDSLDNATVKWKNIEQLDKDWFKTTARLDNPERNISLEGSKYSLSSNLDNQRMQEKAEKISREAEEALSPLEDKLRAIRPMKAYLEKLRTEEADINEIKKELESFSPELYLELNLWIADSIETLLMNLNNNENEISRQIDNIEKRANIARAKLIEETKQIAKEKDNIRKWVLNFFSEIGFDSLGKDDTDAVFQWLNNNPNIMQELGLNAPFDIENGVLGYKDILNSNELSLNKKQVFIRCYNKMLTGHTDFPIWYDAMWKQVFYENLASAENKTPSTLFDMDFFINQQLGWWDRATKMIQNLKNKKEE